MILSLKDGINDGFLKPFKVKQIATTLDDYVYTPDDQLIEGEIEPCPVCGQIPAWREAWKNWIPQSCRS